MRLSIIIPAFNEEKLLPGTLDHVKRASPVFEQAGWTVEVIVCDNNSTDRTGQLATAAGARVVFEPINQIARARNSGAASATGEWLLFIDADSRPSPELFAAVLKTIQSGCCIAGGSTVVLDNNSVASRLVIAFWNTLSRGLRLLAGSFIFCEHAAFKEIGGFSSELFAAEELDLTRKLKPLARSSRRRIVILHESPLLTSARKMHLYTTREHLSFLLRAAFNYKTILRNREACHTWYDGRR